MPAAGTGRSPLSRERVLRAAVELADAAGIEQVSMRTLAQRLDVVPMALYRHVDGKEELLDGMVDAVVAEIEPARPGPDWQAAVRRRVLAARTVLLRHPWASRVVESRTRPTPTVLAYLDSTIAMFRAGGLSPALTHQAMHVLGSRVWGFTQELFPSPPPADETQAAAAAAALAEHFPHVLEIALAGTHGPDGIVGPGCDDQAEFELALDVLLDGFARLHERETATSR